MNPDPNSIPLWSQPTEAGLISSVLNGGTTALDAAMELVHDDWFFAPVNATAWQVLKTLSAKRQPIDLLTFTEGFRQTGELDKIEGGPGFITHEYTRTECSAATVSHWADQLRDYWRRREIHRIGVELMFEARNFQRTSDEILDTSEKSLLDLRLDTKQTGLQHCATAVSEAADRIEQAYKKRGKPIGIATGFHDFDRMTSGLKPSQLIIIAARPSMGKSAFATNIAEHACLADKVPTALFSLEMGAADLMERVLCTQAGVKLQRIRDGFMSKTDMQNLGSKHAEISQAPLYIDETPALSIAAFRARARRAVAKYGVKLLIVDYLQLMKGSSKRAAQDRRLEIDEISSGLKQTAMELAVPVIALSQLNRDAEERAEPKLSHLRESGSIEQDADVVALLHRPERVSHKEEDKGKAVLILAKQRNGPVGRIELLFDAEITKFKNSTEKLYSNKTESRQASSKPTYQPQQLQRHRRTITMTHHEILTRMNAELNTPESWSRRWQIERDHNERLSAQATIIRTGVHDLHRRAVERYATHQQSAGQARTANDARRADLHERMCSVQSGMIRALDDVLQLLDQVSTEP
jgi:replicative DNA helicase